LSQEVQRSLRNKLSHLAFVILSLSKDQFRLSLPSIWRNLLEDFNVEIKEETGSAEKKAGRTDPSTSSG